MPNPKATFDKLSIELFQKFARFEYALKAAGFHCREGDAEPDWRNFARSVGKTLEEPNSEDLQEAIQYILRKPPKKQVIRDGTIQWDEGDPGHMSKPELVLLYVRRVRNNLFHGGKFHGHWFPPDRDHNLLRHSLTIVEACLEASVPVREAYERWD